MEKARAQGLNLAFQGKGRKPHQKSLMVNALHEPSAGFRRSRRHREVDRRSRRKPTHIVTKIQQKEMQGGSAFNCEEADEKEAVEGKIRALQSIVPGGESLGVDKLFEQTAEYIMALQYQVKAMRALSSFFESFEKEKSKCGG